MTNAANETSIFTWDDEHLSLFKSLIAQPNDAIFIVSPDTGRILFCSRRASQNLGYDSDELLQKRIFDLVQNVTNPEEWRALVKNLEVVESLMFETGQVRKNGTILPVEVNVQWIWHDGEPYIVSIARDITDRKQSEALLVSEVSKVEALMRALDDGIIVLDEQLKIIYQNEAHSKMVGRVSASIATRRFMAWKRRVPAAW